MAAKKKASASGGGLQKGPKGGEYRTTKGGSKEYTSSHPVSENTKRAEHLSVMARLVNTPLAHQEAQAAHNVARFSSSRDENYAQAAKHAEMATYHQSKAAELASAPKAHAPSQDRIEQIKAAVRNAPMGPFGRKWIIDTGIPKDELFRAHQQGHVRMSRLDLTSALDAEGRRKMNASEHVHMGIGYFHTVENV